MQYRLKIVCASHDSIANYMERLVAIASNYYPSNFDVSRMVQRHFEADGTLQLAILNNEIIGFSVSSCEICATPFYQREIPVIYQRLLYVDPTIRKKLIGVSLQIAVLRQHLGRFWLFRRFALFCITDNPLILRTFSLYNIHYPNAQTAPTPEVYVFCESLLPLVRGASIEENLLVHGTNESELKGYEYTSWWEEFLASGHSYYDELMLSTVFENREGKVLHKGTLQLVIGYAKPLNFLYRFLQIISRKLNKKFLQNHTAT